MNILFVAAGAPHARRRGYQVRAHHQIRLLAARHRVTLVHYGAPAHALEASVCERVVAVPLPVTAMIAGLLRGAASGRPLQASLYEAPAMRTIVARELASRRHDLVHVQLARLAGLVEGSSVARVIDLVDALSLNMRRRHGADRGPMRIAALLEARRLERFERAICASWDHATVVSAADRDAIGRFPNLTVNPSGVDLQEFCFAGPGERHPRTIVFTGNLGYFPNVDAMLWFTREILPRIRREEPAVRLDIVGDRPSRRVRALARACDAVRIHASVESVVPHLHRAGVAVAPMRGGSGQLFKILEAMACGTPLVATSVASAGTAAQHDRELLVADAPDDFARAVVRVLRTPSLAERLARSARALVEERYGWESSVRQLETIYESVLARRHAADASG